MFHSEIHFMHCVPPASPHSSAQDRQEPTVPFLPLRTWSGLKCREAGAKFSPVSSSSRPNLPPAFPFSPYFSYVLSISMTYVDHRRHHRVSLVSRGCSSPGRSALPLSLAEACRFVVRKRIDAPSFLASKRGTPVPQCLGLLLHHQARSSHSHIILPHLPRKPCRSVSPIRQPRDMNPQFSPCSPLTTLCRHSRRPATTELQFQSQPPLRGRPPCRRFRLRLRNQC